jgi:hypothetical protein
MVRVSHDDGSVDLGADDEVVGEDVLVECVGDP